MEYNITNELYLSLNYSVKDIKMKILIFKFYLYRRDSTLEEHQGV